ncbi:MAG TPA: MFS transporter [Anaerolineales bacterium]|nr:MFS transporter [Anaerolineales bacterium]
MPPVRHYHAWLMAAYYFFFYAAIGVLLPYLPLYYEHIGLRGEQIGLLLGLGPVVLLISGPLWGSLGDRFNLHRWLLPLATTGALAPIFLIPLTRDLTQLLSIVIVQAFFATAIGPLMDSAAIEIAETSGTSFGQLRLGGTIGFMIFSVIIGKLLTFISLAWIFYAYMFFMALAALTALALPGRRRHWNAPMAQGVRALLNQPALLVFLIAAFLIGIALTAAQYFFPLYVRRIGGDSNLLGIAGAIAALSEMPVFFNAKRLLKRINNLWLAVFIATAGYVVRWYALSLTVTPTGVLFVQLLHGVSFGLFIISGVAYVESQAPPGLSATAQALFIAAMWGLGAFVGSLGGGIIFERFGPTALFQSAGVVTLLALALLGASRFFIGRAAQTTS